jgi:hypothetical protein
VDGFGRKTIISMVEGVKKQALELELVDKAHVIKEFKT